jgi:hypothetical protein
MKLQVNESIYSQVLSFVNKFQTNELHLIEDTKQEDYIVSSVEEVQRRVSKAEANGNYISVDNFFSNMDKKSAATKFNKDLKDKIKLLLTSPFMCYKMILDII